MCECQRVHNHYYSKRARDSVAPDSWCVARLNDGLARCVLEWCQVTVDNLTGIQQQQQSVCGPPPAACAPTPARRPRGLLMVHAALTLPVNVWLCGMTRL